MTATEKLLAEYRAAESSILRGQSYSLGDKSVALPDLRWIQHGIATLERRVASENSGTGGTGARYQLADFSR